MSTDPFTTVKTHVTSLRPRMAALSERFYAHLFELDGEIASVFKPDATTRLTKFNNMLTTLTNLKHLEQIAPAIKGVGKRHAGYGVKDRYYGLGRQALLLALQDELGEAFGGELSTAWKTVLDAVIALMLEGAVSARNAKGGTAQILSEVEQISADSLADPTLLEEVGGREQIYDIHLAFYQKLFEDEWLGRFFWGKSETALAKKQTDFMVACMGGANEFTGETPAIAHMHMYITEEMLDLRENILRETIGGFGIGPDLQDRWLRIDNAFRGAVVKHGLDECVLRCPGQRPIQAKKPADYPWPPKGKS